MMNFKIGSLFFFSALLFGCVNKSGDAAQPHHNHNHNHNHNHTHKLTRPLTVSFLSAEKIKVIRSNQNNLSLRIYLKNDQRKLLLESVQNLRSNTYEFSLPDDLSDFTYIAAVVKSSDSNGNSMSSVDTYKIDEQELINSAKKNLKNRN